MSQDQRLFGPNIRADISPVNLEILSGELRTKSVAEIDLGALIEEVSEVVSLDPEDISYDNSYILMKTAALIHDFIVSNPTDKDLKQDTLTGLLDLVETCASKLAEYVQKTVNMTSTPPANVSKTNILEWISVYNIINSLIFNGYETYEGVELTLIKSKFFKNLDRIALKQWRDKDRVDLAMSIYGSLYSLTLRTFEGLYEERGVLPFHEALLQDIESTYTGIMAMCNRYLSITGKVIDELNKLRYYGKGDYALHSGYIINPISALRIHKDSVLNSLRRKLEKSRTI